MARTANDAAAEHLTRIRALLDTLRANLNDREQGIETAKIDWGHVGTLAETVRSLEDAARSMTAILD